MKKEDNKQAPSEKNEKKLPKEKLQEEIKEKFEVGENTHILVE